MIPDIEKDFAGESLCGGRLAFWLDAHHLLTARQHPMRVAHEVREEVEAGPAPASPALVFVRLNERYIEIVEQRLGELGHALDRAEDAILGDRTELKSLGLGPVRRELARYHRQFAGLRGAYHRALAGKEAHATSPVRPHLPQLLQATEDLDHDAGALSERGRLLYEEMDTRIAAATNRSLQTLTIISTLLLPATFVVGAFSMNADDPLGQHVRRLLVGDGPVHRGRRRLLGGAEAVWDIVSVAPHCRPRGANAKLEV